MQTPQKKPTAMAEAIEEDEEDVKPLVGYGNAVFSERKSKIDFDQKKEF